MRMSSRINCMRISLGCFVDCNESFCLDGGHGIMRKEMRETVLDIGHSGLCSLLFAPFSTPSKVRGVGFIGYLDRHGRRLGVGGSRTTLGGDVQVIAQFTALSYKSVHRCMGHSDSRCNDTRTGWCSSCVFSPSQLSLRTRGTSEDLGLLVLVLLVA